MFSLSTFYDGGKVLSTQGNYFVKLLLLITSGLLWRSDRVEAGECTLYPVGTVFALGNIVPVQTKYLLQIPVLPCFETMFEMVERIGGFLFTEL